MGFDLNIYRNGVKGTLIPCKCDSCGLRFEKDRRWISTAVRVGQINIYCSSKCNALAKTTKHSVSCSYCKKLFLKRASQVSRSPNHFCSRSCSVTYNNQNKTHGTRRSKLEAWIEVKLTELYPDLEIHFNRKDAINSELDIYIPSLKLAFELNGIFHYEPIYSGRKLEKIQNNDQRKFAACREAEISLCVIDTSKQNYFKESSSQKFLEIITNIINSRGGGN